MFIHWGLYSLLGRGEWVMHTAKIPIPEYEMLASQFNPTRFSAEEWVSLAADAGQRYIVITSRHHDGFNTEAIHGLPLEVSMTINDHWGICMSDENHKSTQRLLHLLVRAASAGANLLLNVGPTASGEILPVHAQRLREMGGWMEVNGPSIYHTRTGVIPPTSATVSTSRGQTHYVHVLDYISDCVKLEGAPGTVSSASLLRDGSRVKMDWQENLLVLTIPTEQRDSVDAVIVLE